MRHVKAGDACTDADSFTALFQTLSQETSDLEENPDSREDPHPVSTTDGAIARLTQPAVDKALETVKFH